MTKEAGGTETVEKNDVSTPPKYRVIIHNDDYTTMEFVVDILTTIFGHDVASALKIMLQVHNDGAGTAGVFLKDIAETKIDKATKQAEAESFPLRFSMEPDS